MPIIRLDQLQEGMELGEDVLDGNGQLMLRAGAVLSDRDLRRFKMWGVMEVPIAGDEVAEEDAAAQGLSPEQLEACEPKAQHIFRHANRESPLVQLLYDECLHRLARDTEVNAGAHS